MTIRVMGGSARGRKLLGPVGFKFRPATGRVKEFICNYLNQKVVGAKVLDLFSGSGSLGIEALSRGASEVVFTERSAHNVRMIEKNVNHCGFTDNVRVLKGNVFSLFKTLVKMGDVFDIILADPPFKGNYRQRIVQGVDENHLLRDGGVLIVEHESHDPDPGEHNMRLVKQRRFGHCIVSIYN